ncbi:NADH-quinone oxidoreductase subunit H [Candidatus Eisenbacteria bacterium]|uniref:NADH-quinone oxidoreductase subunit H n=1 Tax=Eiseniibacteriota bacterium TaxID=2212470 RepID=A0ABV6YIW6_UNCEI
MDWTFLLVKLGLAALVLLGVLSLAALLSWVERKQSAMIQDRIGANRAPIFGITIIGLFHIIADALKGLVKEDWVPPAGDRRLHFLAPIISVWTVLVTWSVIPFGDVIEIGGREFQLQIADLNIGFLFIFAMMSLGVYGLVLAGFSSQNKYALMGSMRGAAQMIAYEVTFGLTILGLCLIFGTIQLDEIVRAQGQLIGGWIPMWGILVQPIGFILFLVAALAETRRIPFDLSEGESEIVGYFLEYSGMRFLMFWMGEFVAMSVAAALITTFFFGGWQVPYLQFDGFHFPWGAVWGLGRWTVVILQLLSFGVKVSFFIWFLMQIRWTLPRFRFDQVLDLGWKKVLPVAMINLALTATIAWLLGLGRS